MRLLRLDIVGALALLVASVSSQQTSGRPIPPEQAAYDVKHYDLALRVDPAERHIEGELTLRAEVLEPTETVILDLDEAFDVHRVTAGETQLAFKHAEGEIHVRSPNLFQERGSEFVLAVAYGGEPREAPRPPWQGGFTWAKTASGAPWVATSCQSDGADLWWPCKDQPNDEPDQMDLHIEVPAGLVAASNGRLLTVEEKDGWSTYHWHVSTPINAYGVALNIAPYETIESEYQSVAGERFPVIYWVLPENLEKGKELFQDILAQMRFNEEIFGPYPFRIDKYGVAETPHLGMEHQSIIAYGNEYKGNPWGKQRGFDFLHHHEFSHEWWANLVTAENWNDFWIHEGFATYAQALYSERLQGREGYHDEMRHNRGSLVNKSALAPREPKSTQEMYFGNQGSDIYFKGSWVLHTLRYLVGDEAFFPALRRMAYPDAALEKITDGGQCRFATTDEIQAIAEKETGVELDWFFEVYCRHPALPRLVEEYRAGELHLRWEVPGDLPFPMPVEVELDGERVRLEVPAGGASLATTAASRRVDPDQWLLKEEG